MKKKWKYLLVFMPVFMLCFYSTQIKVLAESRPEYEKVLSEEIPFEYQMEQGGKLFASENSKNKVQAKSVQETQVDLYAMSGTYEEYLEIPSSYNQTYQLEYSDSEKPVYSVYSGESVTVSESGLIEPAKTTWYLVENSGGLNYWTTKYIEGAKTRVEVEFGTSVIQVKTSSNTDYITVDVHDYAKEYAQKVMDEYVAEKITDDMSELEKLNVITAFPAQYDYSVNYSGYVGLIVAGGGDCWASTSAILYLCDKTGLTAHMRYAANDAGAGSGHRNVAVSIDSYVYIAEAGYSEAAPRYYSVRKENTGFMYKYSSSDDTAAIVQYDGFDSDIVVPSTIDGHTVTSIGEKAFYYGEAYSNVPVKSLSLPETLTALEDEAISRCKYLPSITIPASVNTIGSFVFTDCEKMEAIYVEDGNSSFSSVDGVLYDASGETLLFYPINGADTFIVPEGVTTVAEYAFYLTRNLECVFLPKSLCSIGLGAFGYSGVSKIYFYGNRPEIGTYALKNASLTAYYPGEDDTWSEIENETYDASSITWKTWNPEAANLSDCMIELSGYDYTYNGKDIEPEVIVKDNGKVLEQGTDYDVSYLNNKNSGTAYVIVSGMDNGDYVGNVQIPFTIRKAEPSISFKTDVLQCGLIEGNVKNPLTYETDGAILYSSSGSEIASVTSDGNVTLKKVGSCIITATAQEGKNYTEKSASYTLNILALRQQQITVEENLTKTYGDKSFHLQAIALGNALLSYSSDNTEVVTVSSDGTVSIVGAGTAKITIEAAATQGYMAGATSVSVTILPKSIKKCRMIFTKTGELPFDNSKFEPYLVVVDGEKILKEYTDYWIPSRSCYGVNGNLDLVEQTIIGNGNYTDSFSGSIAPISQVPTLISASTSESGITLKWEEESGALGYVIYRKIDDGDYSKIKTISTSSTTSWTDSEPNPARGKISYYIRAYTTDGTKYIYSSNSNVKSLSDSQLSIKTSKLTLSGLSKQIAAGKKIKLTASVLPTNASNKAVTWKSSNTKVATVSSSGVVTMKKGTGGKSVTITATAKDGSRVSASWKIKSMKGVVKKVSISGSKSVKAGKSLKLKAKVSASKGANKKVKWTSSNTKYAKVSSSGKVTTYKAGKGKKVMITATATDGSNKKKTVTIKIK